MITTTILIAIACALDAYRSRLFVFRRAWKVERRKTP